MNNLVYLVFILIIGSIISANGCKPFSFLCSCKVQRGGGLLETSDQFRNALINAKPGDTIRLAADEFQGSFQASVQSLTILGRSECSQSTTIVSGNPGLTINGVENYQIRDITFKNGKSSLLIQNSNNVEVKNLILNDVGGDAIIIDSSNKINLGNLVLSNINGKGIQVKGNGRDINIVNSVMKSVNGEMIDIGGQVSNGKINKAVLNGDSSNGDAWIKIDGSNFNVEKVVGRGQPKNGIVINGCENQISGTICSLGGSNGYCIYASDKAKSCKLDIARSNISSGGKGLKNK